jgi:glucose/mannose transport system substrate-binding protein
LGENWTASVALESIIAGQGVAAYEDWINGRMTGPDDRRLLEAFSVLRNYLAHANADHAKTPWDVAIRRVIAGESAFCIMGDWAHGEFRLAGREFGKDYGVIPAPGTKGLYGVSVDAFAQPRGAPDPARAGRWMAFAASRAAQDAFNAAKGSIPARFDAEAARYDRYQRTALADFRAAKVIYPNLTSGAHDAFKTSLDQVMVRFGRDRDVRQAAADVASAAAASQNKFARSWSLR